MQCIYVQQVLRFSCTHCIDFTKQFWLKQICKWPILWRFLQHVRIVGLRWLGGPCLAQQLNYYNWSTPVRMSPSTIMRYDEIILSSLNVIFRSINDFRIMHHQMCYCLVQYLLPVQGPYSTVCLRVAKWSVRYQVAQEKGGFTTHMLYHQSIIPAVWAYKIIVSVMT